MTVPSGGPQSREQILEMAGAFRPACVLGAAAELDLFTVLGDRSLDAETLARQLSADLRGLRMLLDAVAALGLLDKQSERYSVPARLRPWLAEGRSEESAC